MNTLTLLLCLLLLFYTVESLERERAPGSPPIHYATPVPHRLDPASARRSRTAWSASCILLAAFLGCAIVLLVQGKVGARARPVPARLGPAARCRPSSSGPRSSPAVYALTGNRYATYGVGLGVLILTGYAAARGKMNWVGNWNLWAPSHWSDIGAFELDRQRSCSTGCSRSL